MKKRALCWLLALVMIASLLPTFSLPAKAEGEPAFDYAPATDANGGKWTVDDITGYESSGTPVDQYSLGNDLYYLKDGVYYPVDVVNDSEYYYKAYSSRRTIKIYGNFSADSPGAFRSNYGRISAKNDQTDIANNFFIFYNNEPRAVYYNTHGVLGAYHTTLFIYRDSTFSNACRSNSSSTFDSMKRAGTVLIIDNDHSEPSKNNTEEFYAWQTGGATISGHDTYYAEDDLTAPQLYQYGMEGAGKKAIVYTDSTGAQIDYIARNWIINSTSAGNPGNPTYNGTLYYKRDLTQVPVIDPDPTETTTPGGEGGGDSIINPGGVNDAGFKLQKSLEMNTSGSYDIHMESYSTANTVKYGIVEKVPTDFIVVVDQSGSMDTKDMATGYTPVSGTKTLEECASGSYYYKDGDNYYRVYGTKDYLMEYHPTETKWTQNIIEDAGYSLSWFQGEDEATFTQSNQYYYKTNDGVYRPVHVTATGKVGTYYIKFYYKDANGNTVPFIRPTRPIYKNVFGGGDSKYGPNSLGYSAVNPLVLAAYPDTQAYTYSEFIGVTTGMYVNYPMYTRHVGYNKLCYRDVNGVEHYVGSSNGGTVAEYCNGSGQAVIAANSSTRMSYSGLYQATGTETRIAALKGALTDFVKAVAAETDTKNGLDQPAAPVDNRIAIVGFSSLNDGWSGQYNNTEILTGENLTVRNNNGVYIGNASTSDYATALVSASGSGTDGVNQKLYDAIDAITANGGTQPEYGFQMAKSIMDNRSLTQYTLQTGDKSTLNRNVIVVFFTDGQPGDYYISNQYSEANDVVASALPLKTAGAKIFSIGVFGESDGNPLTYYDRTASYESDTKDWKFLGGWMETYKESGTYYCMRRQWRPAGADAADNYTATANDTIFDYMSVTSSNYPGAQQFIDSGWLSGDYTGANGYTGATDGVRHKETSEDTNKFYRMAATQDTLVEAFKQSVSYASTQQQHADVVNLNTTSIFRDVVNTADFDVSHATYSVTWQPIKVDPSLVTPEHPSAIGELENDPDFPVVTPVVNQPVPANGVIEYSGFDYGANFVSMAKLKGYKLVVTVNGIVPTTYNQTIKSNADPEGKDYFACGIYEAGKDKPAYSVKSPTLKVEMHEPATTDVVMNKTLSDPSPVDGSYTITLDAYAKGNSNQQTTTETTGTDVVIVVDKSNSMGESMGNTTRYNKAVEAINAFIDEADDGEADHRIAIVRGGQNSGNSQVIAYNGGTAVNYADLQANADSVFKSVKTESGDLSAALTAMGNGGTVSMYLGPTFDAVSKLLNGRADQSRKAIVIFLSDGKCNGRDADPFNNNVLPVKAAAEVFGIRIDTSGTNKSEAVMKAVSTMYPNATWASNASEPVPGDPSGDVEYYQYINPNTTTDFTGVFDEVMEIIDLNVNLDKDAYLLDIINLENLALRSDLSEPIVTVKTQKGTIDRNGSITWDENVEDITDRVTVTYDSETGAVKVIGFDYSANYIGYPKPVNVQEGTARNQGKKLIVEIAGLVPKHPGENQTSNTRAGVYDKEDDPAKEVPSPTFSITSDTSKTYVIDFSAPMTIATDAKSVAKMSGKNGDFTLVGTDVVYQITKSVEGNNLVLEGVDQAFAFGKPVGMTLDNPVWSVLTTIPAGSVYFDDGFSSLTKPLTVGDGRGWNSGVSVSPATENEEPGKRTFTFYGTGIDIYCTTYNMQNGGYVQAKLTQNGQPVADQKNQSVRNYSETTRYNVPTISFTGLPAGEYTVTLNVLGTSNYKLDGVRIYNPVSNETYEGQGTHEQYAAYINMREALVNNTGISQAFSDSMDDAVLGALFVDDSTKMTRLKRITDEEAANYDEKDISYVDEQGNVVEKDTEGASAAVNAYETQFDAYKENSPKHEIYLSKNQAIIFQLTTAAESAAASGNLWIGLSAPDQNKNTGTVTLKEGKTINVTSGVDMYYPITSDMIGANRVVTITNTGDNMISVTNLKITGNADIYNAANGTAQQPTEGGETGGTPASVEDAIPMVFEPMTMQTVKIAANNGVDPDAPVVPDEPDTPDTPDEPDDPKPGWNDDAWNPANILQTLFKLLLDSLRSLFSGLGNW